MKAAALALVLFPLIGLAAPPPPGTIAFVRVTGDNTADTYRDVFVARADGTGKPRAVTDIGTVSSASWSPDRRWLAITQPGNGLNEAVSVVRSSGGKPRQISTGSGSAFSPSWSSDGRLVAYQQEAASAASVWVSTTSGAKKRLAFGYGVAWHPSQPRTLAYVWTDGIYVAVVGEHSQRRLFVGDFYSVHWSPDGRRIVTDSFANPARRRSGDLYVYSLSSGKRTNVSHTGGSDRDPAWSPDGRRIAWSSGNHIWVVNADSSRKRRLTSTKDKYTADIRPTWSPDGRSIVFMRSIADSCRLYLVRIQGGPARPLFPARAEPRGANGCDRDPVWFR